jgi:hypothetical protein
LVRDRLNVAPPKWVQVTAVVAIGILMPAFLILGNPSWKWNWSLGAVISFAIYGSVLVGFVLLTLGVTGGNLTSPEKDKESLERFDALRRKYWWVLAIPCLVYLGYVLSQAYA